MNRSGITVAESGRQDVAKGRRFVERLAFSLRPGDSLLPMRALMEATGLGQKRLESIIDQLVADHVLERQPRRGIFRTVTMAQGNEAQQGLAAGTIDLVACAVSDYLEAGMGFYPELIEVFSSEAARRHYSVRLHRIGRSEPFSTYERLLTRGDIVNCILFNPHTQDLVTLLEAQVIHWVAAFPRFALRTNNQLLDAPDTVQVQLDYLYRRGHRRIGYISQVNPEDPHIVQLQRLNSYFQIMAAYGLPVNPAWFPYGGRNDESLFAALEIMFAAPPYPTAVVVYDTQIGTAYRFIEKRGWEVGREVSVLATDDLAANRLFHPAPSSSCNSRLDIARLLIAMLENIAEGSLPDAPVFAPLTLTERDSVARLADGDLPR